jgi:ribose transport system ATP-binding protein
MAEREPQRADEPSAHPSAAAGWDSVKPSALDPAAPSDANREGVRTPTRPSALQFERITKSFSGVRVLRDVTFAVPAGATLGLVGENGAGKSTLMNILGGNLRPDAGRMTLAGGAYAPARPADATAAGIAFVHQELNLFPNLTVGENLFLTRFPRRGPLPLIHRARLAAATVRRLREVGLAAAPDTPVERLSAGERQLVEIARALSFQPRLLILDEPTTSLSDRETRHLFALLEQLRARGLAMIYISHTLEDVLRLSDRIAVLRDGEVVGQGARSEFDVSRLVALMVGRSLTQLYPTRSGTPVKPSVLPPVGRDSVEPGKELANLDAPLARPSARPNETLPRAAPPLAVRGLTQPGVVRGISFTLARGEVLGVFGLMGAGRSELARILFGLDPFARGSIHLCGASVDRAPPARRIQRGLAFLTEDRREEGLALEASIADNIALVTLRRHARPLTGWLDLAGLRAAVGRMRAAVRLTPTARDEAPVKTLSGGNQQKVVLARWLLARPRALILDEPTRGIDVGAKFEIYQLIHQLADDGAGVLVISSELEELIGICDRILVMRRGEIVEELPRPAFDRERILRAALREGTGA